MLSDTLSRPTGDVQCENTSAISGKVTCAGLHIDWAMILPADLAAVLINRLEYLQITPDAKPANMHAIECIRDALEWLED